jgi:hypothetical protein
MRLVMERECSTSFWQISDNLQATRHLSRAAHRQTFNAKGGLAHTHWHALTFFAANAHTAVKPHVVANHADLLQAFRATAN